MILLLWHLLVASAVVGVVVRIGALALEAGREWARARRYTQQAHQREQRLVRDVAEQDRQIHRSVDSLRQLHERHVVRGDFQRGNRA